MRQARNLFFAIMAVGLLATILPATSAEALPTGWNSSVVYVENHAPKYPVKRVAENMDNGSSLDLRVVKRCPARAACIKIYTANMSGGQFADQSGLIHDGYTSRLTIRLDRRWERQVSAKMERVTVCHELAMGLGLRHTRRGTNSCTSFNKRKDKISKSERRQLDRLY